MKRQSRVGLRPPAQPVVGTYWLTDHLYVSSKIDPPLFIAVVSVERKYARMGIQDCFVSFVKAYEYATSTMEGVPFRLEHNIFFEIFEAVSDEDLGYELGLEILANYDR